MTVELTIEQATNAIRSGIVRMTMAEWLALDAETQAALAEAGRLVDAERALIYATAIHDPGGLLADVDPDEAEIAGDVAALNRALSGGRIA